LICLRGVLFGIHRLYRGSLAFRLSRTAIFVDWCNGSLFSVAVRVKTLSFRPQRRTQVTIAITKSAGVVLRKHWNSWGRTTVHFNRGTGFPQAVSKKNGLRDDSAD